MLHLNLRALLFLRIARAAAMTPRDFAGDASKRVTVGIIVIGDEILKGSTLDVNSNFMCRRLHARGVYVRKISVVSDLVDEIAAEISEFSNRFDIVFTTGGIGPTHDDRTFAGIAQAFGEELTLNLELKHVVDQFLHKSRISDVDEAVKKFCSIPQSAKLIWPSDCVNNSDERPTQKNTIISASSKSSSSSSGATDEKAAEKSDDSQAVFPSFRVRNVISLPGVPTFCERNFEYLENYLFPENNPFFSRTLFLEKNEIHLERKLSKIASDYSDRGVSIGSYPIMDNNYFKTKLIVESESHGEGAVVHGKLSSAFRDYLVDFDETPWRDAPNKLAAFRAKQSPEFQAKIDDALNTIDETLDTYGLGKIALSFNGGKDCTILLHLFRCCVNRRFGLDTPIRCFQVLNNDEFPEVCDFVDEISKKYNLKMMRVNASLRTGLAHLKHDHPDIVAVLMGSRRADPNGQFMASRCEWTDADWPRFFRVCPVLDWTYMEVWSAIRGLCIPYCRIYDRGYTSLGSCSSTHPNPALLTIDENGRRRYLPAYCLKDEKLERSSRENSQTSLSTLVAVADVDEIK